MTEIRANKPLADTHTTITVYATNPIEPIPSLASGIVQQLTHTHGFFVDVLNATRPWNEFTEWHKYSVPSTAERGPRIAKNATSYYYNYCVASCLGSLWVLCINWLLYVCVAIVVGMFVFYRARMARLEQCVIGGFLLAPNPTYTSFATAMAGLFLFMAGGVTSLVGMIAMGGILGLHAMCREPPAHESGSS